ncbi:MAG: single-stranded-DNA-specific exonuclease RecJ [Thiohalomonadaceae bacterium]
MKHKPRIERRTPAPVPADFPEHLHPVMARLYAARGVRSAGELELTLKRLLPAHSLAGLDAATALLSDALERRQRILVLGDFDADGATSTALAVRALRAMGAAHVDFLVPDRFRYGYGLTPAIVEVAAAHKPDLLITVDNGISSLAGVAAARAAGMRVLITDHHLPGHELPAAEAIVNPNQPDCVFPSKSLAGVGVIFYVLTALRARLRADGWFVKQGIEEPNLADYLDLVALGTVADVAVLDANNRVLVAQGVARIRAGRACAGIEALLRVSGRDAARLASSDLGFVLGPRLNAAGRLDDMSIGIRCLLAQHPEEAEPLARELDRLNVERRAIEAEMQAEALAELERMQLNGVLPFGLCLFEPHWHEGVIGLLASRVKERVYRPVVVFTTGENGELKGSARSVPGFHMRDALEAIATREPDLLLRFGGHAMAAGLALRHGDFERFQEVFDAQVRAHLDATDLDGILLTDGELSAQEARLELAEQIRTGGPWGQGFPEPRFDGRFEIVQQRVVKDRHLKMLVRWPDTSRTVDAIAFNTRPCESRHVHGVYRLDVNTYRGEQSLQFVMDYMEPC